MPVSTIFSRRHNLKPFGLRRIRRYGKLWRLRLFWSCLLQIGCHSEPRCPEFRFMDQCTKAGARWEDCEESALVQGLMVQCDKH